ncbi:MAG TPA: isocitrate lyase/phosphoenolpyruvate mutase family protein, partial [Candidatus Limnocylindria bacterium]|nr:isocitrate lyase/phosphoenolpyruvate mutase family protein [Candidatus Limnocylindria bacterium]
SAVAEALGYEDGERAPADEMFAALGRIAGGVELPVSGDVEAGYGLGAADLVERVLGVGAVGLNYEDTDRSGPLPRLVPLAAQAETIAALRAASGAVGVALVINARIDVYLRGSGSLEERTDEAIARGRAYLEAGADCVYPIMLTHGGQIARLVAALRAPVNVILRPGSPSIDELARMGVRRISVGGGLSHRIDVEVERMARELLGGDGTAFTGG